MKKISFPAVLLRFCYPLTVRFVLCLLCLVISMCTSQVLTQKKAAPVTTTQETIPAFTYKIIPAANGTYGYDIYADGKLRIHQPAIPALSGNDGFKTKAAAEKVAALAVSKMKKGESLPTISPEELKKLKAI